MAERMSDDQRQLFELLSDHSCQNTYQAPIVGTLSELIHLLEHLSDKCQKMEQFYTRTHVRANVGPCQT